MTRTIVFHLAGLLTYPTIIAFPSPRTVAKMITALIRFYPDGIHSSGYCCRLTRHSLFILRHWICFWNQTCAKV